MRPSKQRELAKAPQAQMIEIDADHDAPLVIGAECARLARLAAATVAAAARVETAT